MYFAVENFIHLEIIAIVFVKHLLHIKCFTHIILFKLHNNYLRKIIGLHFAD